MKLSIHGYKLIFASLFYIFLFNNDDVIAGNRKGLKNDKLNGERKYNGPSNKFIFRATYGNSIVCNIFPA
jgi:hypothetical protein